MKKEDFLKRKAQATQKFFQTVGLTQMPEAQRPAFLRQVRQTLQNRIGERLAKDLTEAELKQFYDYVKSKQPQQAMDYLHKIAPHHRQVLIEEMAKLQQEIKTDAKKILDNL